MLLFPWTGGEVKDGGECHGSDMEGDEPDGEDLGHGYVELKVVLVECCGTLLARWSLLSG